MYVWRHIPLLRFLLPFIAGIVFYESYAPRVIYVVIYAIIGLLSILGGHIYLAKAIHRPVQRVVSIIALTQFFVAGVLLTHAYKEVHYPSHLAQIENADEFLVRICNLPEEKIKSLGCEVELLSAISNGVSVPVSGHAQVYFAKDKQSRKLAYGEHLVISNALKRVSSPSNPHQFDFKTYYEYRNIFHQGYLKSGTWHTLHTYKRNSIVALSYTWQAFLKDKFKIYFDDKAVRGVAQAIVFGYKEELDDDWLEAFSQTGTIHVLAVSGLHVGIIYILLSAMLFIKRSKGWQLKLKSLIIVLCLFAYCLLTGFAPSVSRASIMFGVVIIAKAFQRQSNIYNTLSFACFLLLVINPYNLYSVGFQFSFLAVLGIVYYKDIFRKLLPGSSSLIGDKISMLFSVSVAAQITTFPLGLYYFHQYPNLFMISNLIVIPCITVILYAGILFVGVVSFCDYLAALCAEVVSIYIKFIANVVHFIQDIPYAFFEGVHITFWQMIMVYLFTISLTAAWRYKLKLGYIMIVLTTATYIGLDIVYEKELLRDEVIVFDVGREFLVGFRHDKEITFVASKDLLNDASKLEYTIEPYVINERLTYSIVPDVLMRHGSQFKNVSLMGNGFVWFNKKRYLFTDHISEYISNTAEADVIIVGNLKRDNFLKAVSAKLKASVYYCHVSKTQFLQSLGLSDNGLILPYSEGLLLN